MKNGAHKRFVLAEFLRAEMHWESAKRMRDRTSTKLSEPLYKNYPTLLLKPSLPIHRPQGPLGAKLAGLMIDVLQQCQKISSINPC